MNKIVLRNVLSCIAVLFFVSCGGGGGGGSSQSSASTGVRVLHGSIDAVPMQIVSSLRPSEVVTTAYFGEQTLYGELSTGPQNISLTRLQNTSRVVSTTSLTVEKNQRRTLLLYGNNETFGLRTALLADAPGDIPQGKAAVRVVHALVGAGNVNVNSGAVVLASGVNFGEGSSYSMVDTGVHSLAAFRGSDALQVGSATVEFVPGVAYTILVTGEVGALALVKIYEDNA